MTAAPRLPRLVLAAALLILPALRPSSGSGASMAELASRVIEADLPNGLRVLLLPRHKTPTVSLYLRFLAGSVQEEEGRSGVAHLLEHMMFKGTTGLGTKDWSRERPLRERIEEVAALVDEERMKGGGGDPDRLSALQGQLRSLQDEARLYSVKDEIDSIYTANGAQGLNASTGVDLTTYKVSLPSNRLALWAVIESERLRDPVMREFYSERDVVVEERRQSFETDPSRKLMALLLSTAFTAHPYRRPVIGWAGDVDLLTSGEAERFFRTWYSPGNAVLAAVGDFDASVLLEAIAEHFGSLPSVAVPGRRLPVEPEQEGERRAVLLMDAQPEVMIAFHKPTLPSREDYVFDMIDGLLTLGRTSRLHRRLVEEDQIALGVYSSNGVPGGRYPNLFIIGAKPRSPHTSGDVERAVLEELARLSLEAPSAAELGRVRKQMRANTLRGLQSNEGLASLLSYFEAVAGDWRYAVTHLDVLEEITAEEVRRTAALYLTDRNRTVVALETAVEERNR